MEEYSSQVYLIATQDLRFVKIGFSTRLFKRLLGLQEDGRTWSLILDQEDPGLALLASFPGNIELEFFLHKKWEKFKLRREWFYLRDALKQWALRVCEEPDETLTALLEEFESSRASLGKLRAQEKEARDRDQQERRREQMRQRRVAVSSVEPSELQARLNNLTTSQLKSVKSTGELPWEPRVDVCSKCWGPDNSHRVWCQKSRS